MARLPTTVSPATADQSCSGFGVRPRMCRLPVPPPHAAAARGVRPRRQHLFASRRLNHRTTPIRSHNRQLNPSRARTRADRSSTRARLSSPRRASPPPVIAEREACAAHWRRRSSRDRNRIRRLRRSRPRLPQTSSIPPASVCCRSSASGPRSPRVRTEHARVQCSPHRHSRRSGARWRLQYSRSDFQRILEEEMIEHACRRAHRHRHRRRPLARPSPAPGNLPRAAALTWPRSPVRMPHFKTGSRPHLRRDERQSRQ